MKRKPANLEIVNRLSEYLTQNPDMRFGQALRNLGIIEDFMVPPEMPGDFNPTQWSNHFYEEPWDMLKRMDKRKGS